MTIRNKKMAKPKEDTKTSETFERKQQIDLLIRFFNMQAGTSYKVSNTLNRESVNLAIDRACGDIVTLKNYVREFVKTGSKVISVILDLEQQGYRFNFYQVQGYSESSDCDMMCVKLKDAAQPIDLKRMSFPIAHTAFFRVIGFDWYSKTPKGKYRRGYGHALCHEGRVNNKLPEMFKEMFGNNAVYISGNKLLKEKEPEKYLKEVFTNGSVKN